MRVDAKFVSRAGIQNVKFPILDKNYANFDELLNKEMQ